MQKIRRIARWTLCALALVLPGTTALFSAEQPAGKIIEFSGRKWLVKDHPQPMGPGPNLFRAHNISIDTQGRLHLQITEHNGQWTCAEVGTTESLGYGRYEFQVTGPLSALDRNVVLGLFTWDNQTFQTDANSEIDIEFARWGVDREDMPNLFYTIQPIFGPDEPGGRYDERGAGNLIQIPHKSTHVFTWLPNEVTFKSYEGHGTAGNVLAEWKHPEGKPRRAKLDEKTSGPVTIPRPGKETTARINLWLTGPNGNVSPPSDQKEVEVIIDRFVFEKS